MMTKLTITVGQNEESISEDLLIQLGFRVYTSTTAGRNVRDESYEQYAVGRLAEVLAHDLHGDVAALVAIRLMRERRESQALETARQKVAEIELAAAKERRAAEGIALARQRELLASKG